MKLKSLGLAIEVLKNFTVEKPMWGLRELSQKMNINHTILYRILKTYESEDFIIQDSDSKKYKLGPGLASILSAYKIENNPSNLIYPAMVNLSEKVGESVFLTWKMKDYGLTVEAAESPSNIRFSVTKGTRIPLYVGSSTKVIMAHLKEEEQISIIRQGINQITKYTITKEEELIEDLKKIKAQGWSYTEGELSEDVFGISTPIFNEHNEVIASLNIAGPLYRITQDKLLYMKEELFSSTEKITNYLSLFEIDYYY